MAGTGPSPAARGQSTDSDAAPVEARWSRRRLLHVFLITTIAVAVPLILVEVARAARAGSEVSAGRLAGDLAFLTVLVILVYINRSGRTELASWVFCAALVINGSEFFTLAELDRVMALYALPIVLAAFLLRPVAAFHLLGLSVADYLIAYLRHAREVPFNWLTLVILAGVAVTSWLAARRAAWFEEAEEMYRRELDVVIGELDEAQARADALRAELDAERSFAGRGEGGVPVVAAGETPSVGSVARGVWRAGDGPGASGRA